MSNYYQVKLFDFKELTPEIKEKVLKDYRDHLIFKNTQAKYESDLWGHLNDLSDLVNVDFNLSDDCDWFIDIGRVKSTSTMAEVETFINEFLKKNEYLKHYPVAETVTLDDNLEDVYFTGYTFKSMAIYQPNNMVEIFDKNKVKFTESGVLFEKSQYMSCVKLLF